jgi:ABC-type branched-subunit amino acid transport system substrate-binding protein
VGSAAPTAPGRWIDARPRLADLAASHAHVSVRARIGSTEGRQIVRRSVPVIALLLALVASACDAPAPAATRSPSTTSSDSSKSPPPTITATPSGSVAPEHLQVLYVLDTSVEGADESALPAQQAIQLAFAGAAPTGDTPPVDLVAYDLQGDPNRLTALADQVASDPSIVALVIAPPLEGQRAVESAVRLPVLSLSPRDGAPDDGDAWRRLVPRIDEQGTVLGHAIAGMHAARRGVCLAPDQPNGSRFAQSVVTAIGDAARLIPTAAPADVRAARCGVLAWTSDAETAVQFLAGLGRPRPRLVGGPALREPTFLTDAGHEAQGARSWCGCADVSTSLQLAAQRFIQDFQSEYGRAPGPGAVEGWDAAHLLLRGLRDGGAEAASLGAWIERRSSFVGLGGEYRFDRTGELADPRAHMRAYRVDGGRWIPATP